jgi:hypothetical protein
MGDTGVDGRIWKVDFKEMGCSGEDCIELPNPVKMAGS